MLDEGQTSISRASLATVPQDVLHNILQEAGAPSSLACKAFAAAYTLHNTHLCPRNVPTTQELLTLLNNSAFRKYTTLDLSMVPNLVSDELLAALPACFPCLQSLQIIGHLPTLTTGLLTTANLSHSFPSLTSLRIDNTRAHSLESPFRSQFTQPYGTSILPAAPASRLLAACGTTTPPPHTTTSPTGPPHRLLSLDLHNTPLVLQDLCALPTLTPHLTHLSLSECGVMVPEPQATTQPTCPASNPHTHVHNLSTAIGHLTTADYRQGGAASAAPATGAASTLEPSPTASLSTLLQLTSLRSLELPLIPRCTTLPPIAQVPSTFPAPAASDPFAVLMSTLIQLAPSLTHLKIPSYTHPTFHTTLAAMTPLLSLHILCGEPEDIRQYVISPPYERLPPQLLSSPPNLSTLTSLTQLSLSGMQPFVSVAKWLPALPALTVLKCLTLGPNPLDATYTAPLRSLTVLEYLDVVVGGYADDLLANLAPLSSLTELRLKGGTMVGSMVQHEKGRLGNPGWEHLARISNQLHALELSGFLYHLADSLLNLVHVMPNVDGTVERAGRYAGTWFPEVATPACLTRLCMKDSVFCHDHELQCLAAATHIQDLTLDGLKGLCWDDLSCIGQLNDLSRLSLRHCPGIQYSHLNLLSELSAVRVAEFALNESAPLWMANSVVGASSDLSFLQHWRNLGLLDLSGCRNVPPIVLLQAAQHLPSTCRCLVPGGSNQSPTWV